MSTKVKFHIINFTFQPWVVETDQTHSNKNDTQIRKFEIEIGLYQELIRSSKAENLALRDRLSVSEQREVELKAEIAQMKRDFAAEISAKQAQHEDLFSSFKEQYDQLIRDLNLRLEEANAKNMAKN